MLKNVKVDVVSICTPDSNHLQCLRKLKNKVRGIFLEKPICSINEIKEAKNISSELKKTNTCINSTETL